MICFFSLIFFITVSFRKSSVRVELDVRTREDRVDMDADSTRITTMPTRMSGSPDSIKGMMLSYTTEPSAP